MESIIRKSTNMLYIQCHVYKAGVAVHCKGGQPCWHVHNYMYTESGENSP